MPDVSAIQRPSLLWKSLSPEQKLQAADAFWKDGNAGVEQAEMIATIAQRIKFRPKSVVALPREKKSRHLLNLGTVSEMVAARLLVAYHLDHRRPMMATFLDALGIKHEDGLISEENVETPSAERLREGVDALIKAYSREDVALYLSTLVWQDPDTWGELAEMPEARLEPQAQP